MRFGLYKTLWGAVGGGTAHRGFAEVIPAVAAEGWDGVAFAFIAHEFDAALGSDADLAAGCRDHGLDLAVMIHTFGDTVADHLEGMRAGFERAAELEPHHVIAHAGADSFEERDAVSFLEASVAMASDLGLRVGHETHRSRILFNPWTTRRMLERVDGLELVVDLSHWVVVAERLITDAADLIEECGARAIHVDARVGHEQGPQVHDPFAERWQEHRAVFESWWDSIWDAAAGAGRQELVFVPEYGPPPYQATGPDDGEPIGDLWETCAAAGRSLRDRYGPDSG
jgi:hypothetical protein